jgi:hypothetical protein
MECTEVPTEFKSEYIVKCLRPRGHCDRLPSFDIM